MKRILDPPRENLILRHDKNADTLPPTHPQRISHLYQLDRSISSLRVVGWYSKTCVKRPLKNRQNKGLNDNW